ncbi:helix-turn-helix domain-containing protein [Streptomyces sp. NPDC001980]|uniref:winged helix-turn-helix transcriptional regulator n=1 Tax=Streptomyces sp. NPDC001980 TaxID=3157126 RepID=UPI00331AC535
MLPSTYPDQDCSLARALEVVGERWTLLVMRDAFYGVRRFNDFSAHLDAPRSVLSARLAALVDAGLLERRPDPEHGGRRLYEVTDKGRTLWPPLYALRAWGEAYAAGDHEPGRTFTHAHCGRPLDPTARCVACDTVPEPQDVMVIPLGTPGEGARTDPVALGLRKPHRLLDPLPGPDTRPVGRPAGG